MKEKKDRVDDALAATRAAVEEGIVPGGGVAYIRATAALEGLKGANDDQTTGIQIVKRAIEEPLRQNVANAGGEGSVVVNKVREGEGAFGYNARDDKYEDMLKAGIIDPTKVSRVALENAASIASMFLTTECVLAEKKSEQPAMPAMPAGKRYGRHDVTDSRSGAAARSAKAGGRHLPPAFFHRGAGCGGVWRKAIRGSCWPYVAVRADVRAAVYAGGRTLRRGCACRGRSDGLRRRSAGDPVDLPLQRIQKTGGMRPVHLRVLNTPLYMPTAPSISYCARAEVPITMLSVRSWFSHDSATCRVSRR